MVASDRLRLKIIAEGVYHAPSSSRELLHMDHKGAYRWQFYLRGCFLDREAMREIGEFFWSRHAGEEFQLGAIEVAGVPVLMAILAHAPRPVNAFTIKKTPKAYGLQNWIEGRPNDLPVLLVDDLTSPQHNMFWASYRTIRNARLQLHSSMFVVVNKQHMKHDTIETGEGILKISFMYDLDDLELR